MTRILLILIVGVGATGLAHAGAITQKKGAAALEIRYDGDTPRLALSDQIKVTLTVEGSPALDVFKGPLDLPAAAMWVLVERSRDSRESIGPGRVRWKLVYHFAPREPGEKIVFHFPDVSFRDDDKDQTVSWTPLEFAVVTQIDPANSALRDITTIETVPSLAPPDARWHWWLAAAALLLLLVAAIVVTRILVRRKGPRTPAQVALYELQRLITMKLPEKGRSERFATLLTTVVRRYLERRFAMPARRRTTPEFVRELVEATALSAEQKQFLLEFLQRCEAVKFGRQGMSVEECGDWSRRARDFFSKTMPASQRR
jgi:hypothetical protein